MKPLAVILAWFALTAFAARFVPDREQPQPIAYTRSADDLQRDFPTVDTSPGQAAHLLRTIQLNTLSTQPTIRSGPTTTTTRPLYTQPVPRRTYPAGVEQWRELVSQYPWPVDTMLDIMRCESGGDPTNYYGRSAGYAWSRNRASGLFQLLPAPPGWDDPATNVRLAYETKYAPSGLSPWTASAGCW